MTASRQPIRRVIEAADVTPEVMAIVEDIEEGWFNDTPIDWDDFIDRLDGSELADGSVIDMGPSMASGAIREIKKRIRELRRGE